MKKYMRTPDDPLLPITVFWQKRFGNLAPKEYRFGRALIGPDKIFGEYNLGNISSSRMQFVVLTYATGGSHDKHVHDDNEQAYYIIAGQASVTIGEDTSVLGPGGVALIALGIPHGFHNAGVELLTLLDLHTYQFDDVPPSKLGVAEVTYGLQGGVEAHAHSDREKAYYIISGQASVKIGKEEAALGAGSVAFIPRHVTHAYRNVGDEPLKLAVVSSYDV